MRGGTKVWTIRRGGTDRAPKCPRPEVHLPQRGLRRRARPKRGPRGTRVPSGRHVSRGPAGKKRTDLYDKGRHPEKNRLTARPDTREARPGRKWSGACSPNEGAKPTNLLRRHSKGHVRKPTVRKEAGPVCSSPPSRPGAAEAHTEGLPSVRRKVPPEAHTGGDEHL